MAKVDQSIFRTYDIRGIVPNEFDECTAYLIGRSLATKMRKRALSKIVCGQDIRLTTPMLSQAVMRGLLDGGVDVVNIGVCTTPLLYYTCKTQENLSSGVMITASHNPAEYNGAKIVIENHALTTDEIQALYQNCCDEDFTTGKGTVSSLSVIESYIDDIASRISLPKKMRVAVDFGNSVSAIVVPKLFERLGVEVVPLFEEIDGSFPNHPPEPTQPKYLVSLQALVKREAVDLAFAFDGDADRMVCLDGRGNMIYPDRVLMLFAQLVLKRHTGRKIVYDVKCNHHLSRIISEESGIPILSPTGHTVIKQTALRENAVLAGEMSGHFIFYDDWYGFDDGVYAACRLLEILSKSETNLYDLNHCLPSFFSTAEIQLPASKEESDAVLNHFSHMSVDGAFINKIDGVRIEFSDGFGLVRASNTTPCLIFRFVADTQQKLEDIQRLFDQELKTLSINVVW